jgi:hypothetical protein
MGEAKKRKSTLLSHTWMGMRASVAILATMLCPVAGCGGPAGQFYVVQNQLPGAGCAIPAGKAAVYQGEGVLDIRVPSTHGDTAYLLFPLLKNDLPAEGQGGGEPNRIALGGFEIDIAFVDGSDAARDFFATLLADPAQSALLRYQAPWSGSVDPAGGTTAAATNAFPAETARLLRANGVLADPASNRAHVDVKIRAFGQTQSGGIKSDVFRYPLQICDGCLINSITSCPAKGPVLQGGMCNPGQDAMVDCCTAGADLICPATSAS